MEKPRATWRQRVRTAVVLLLLSAIGVSGALLVAYGGRPVHPF